VFLLIDHVGQDRRRGDRECDVLYDVVCLHSGDLETGQVLVCCSWNKIKSPLTINAHNHHRQILMSTPEATRLWSLEATRRLMAVER